MFWSFGPEACGILAPGPGIEPSPPAVEAQSLNHWTAREVPGAYFFMEEKSGVCLVWMLQSSELPAGPL